VKRVIDLGVAAIAALPVLPFALLIALAVKLTSPGPILYWSERIGRHSRVFRMPKFRTMKVGTPAVATHLMQDPAAALTPKIFLDTRFAMSAESRPLIFY